MEITDKLIKHLCNLSKLKFNADEILKIKEDLQKNIDSFSTLQEIDTENIEPLEYITEEFLKLRKDEIHQEITQRDALKNSVSKDSDYFLVPKFIKQD